MRNENLTDTREIFLQINRTVLLFWSLVHVKNQLLNEVSSKSKGSLSLSISSRVITSTNKVESELIKQEAQSLSV